MSVFVDTSGILAVMDASESSHARAAAAWRRIVGSGERLVTTSYVLVELFALTQARFGIEAVRDLERSVVPLLSVVWVDGGLHARGVAALLAAGRRRLSLVDCVSFEAMRDGGITRCFSLDRHFTEMGMERMA